MEITYVNQKGFTSVVVGDVSADEYIHKSISQIWTQIKRKDFESFYYITKVNPSEILCLIPVEFTYVNQ